MIPCGFRWRLGVGVATALSSGVYFYREAGEALPFILCLTGSYFILIMSTLYRRTLHLCTYFTVFLMSALPAVFEVPDELKNHNVLLYIRAAHVALLSARTGYGLNLNLFRSRMRYLYAFLAVSGFVIDVVLTFTIMKLFGFSTDNSLLMATISPAPSCDVATPFIEAVIASCEEGVPFGPRGEMIRARRTQMRDELIKMRGVFNTSAMPLTLFTVALFRSVASGVDFNLNTSALGKGVTTDATEMFGYFGLGLIVASAICISVLGLSYTGFKMLKDAQSEFVAAILYGVAIVCCLLGTKIPVVAAVVAIGASVCLRAFARFNEDAAAILDMIWPFTTNLYHGAFAYPVVGYYWAHPQLFDARIGRIFLGSLVPLMIKFLFLVRTSRLYKVSWPASLTLALSLCSKGTVQMALCTAVALQLVLQGGNTSHEDFYSLQLFVLVNNLLILLLIVSASTVLCAKIQSST